MAERGQADRPEQPGRQERAGVVNPHDALFRQVFSDPANAASQLRSVLPTELVERLDLDRLERCPGSFVDEELRWRHADLLYSAPLDGQDAFVYVLVEHQSSTDPLMAFRMLRYMVRIWDRYLKYRPRAVKLPAVIPMVVHHNEHPWHGPVELYDLFDVDDETAKAAGEHLPRFRFLLEDLTRLDEQTLRIPPLTRPARMAKLLLKTVAGNPRLIDDLVRWADEIEEVGNGQNGMEYLVVFVAYIEAAGEVPPEELHDLFIKLGPKMKEAYMTTAEQLQVRGQIKMLVRLLELKFGPLSPAVLDVVQTASAEQIDTWADRILSADTLDDVLDTTTA